MKNEREDFPDFFSPMLVKELRQGMRTRIFVSSFLVLQVLMAIMISLNAMDYGNNPEAFSIRDLNGMFWAICGLLLVVAMPLRGVTALSNEEKARTLELIFLTRLTSWRIVLGKWASLMFQAILFALAVLPYGVLRYFFGNVNLVDDLLVLSLLLLASALLTAATVGISGYSIFLKGALLVFGGIVAMPVAGILIDTIFAGGTAMRMLRLGSISEWVLWFILISDSLILGLYFLEMAAAHIAPDAENHMQRKRGLALLGLLITAGMILAGVDKSVCAVQLTFSCAVLGFCCIESVCTDRPVMRAHVERFARRGRYMSLFGRLFYPGWASGAAFTFMAAALVMLVFWTLPVTGDFERLRGNAGILSGVAALLTPLVIFSLVMKRWRQSPIPFFIVQITLMAVAIFAYAASEITQQRFPIEAMLPIPVASLWVIVFGGVKDVELIAFAIAAAIMVIVYFFLVVFWSVPYWKRIREMETAIRAAKVPVVAPLEEGVAEPAEGGQ